MRSGSGLQQGFLACFDEEADFRFRARVAQQHAALCAEFLLDVLDQTGHFGKLIERNPFLDLHVDQKLRIFLHALPELAQG